jgi:tripartite-type tricarboxylate transporter receptor subunit TctC
MALAVGLACSAVSALAQQYPTRPIRFVQGFAAGGNAT